jgi:hypothetical protein
MEYIKLLWLPRYSDTMEDDNLGRWARVCYAGNLSDDGFIDGKVSRWEIAWIKKVLSSYGLKFVVDYQFPCNSTRIFDNVGDAKAEVERQFQWFIKTCLNG